MPKEAKQPDANYKACQTEWERRRKTPDRGAGDWMTDRPELPVAPRPFLQTLRTLAYLTNDTRFTKLHATLMGGGLIDLAAGTWALDGTPILSFLPELIEEAIANGSTERQAIAAAVADFVLYPDAQSFDAAWKRLERLLHEWRNTLDRNPPKKV